MSTRATDLIPVSVEIEPLIASVMVQLKPSAIWLFGSRARGDAQPESDWDLLVSLPDDAPADFLDPVKGWTIQREVGIRATVLATRSSDLADVWGVPNTLGFDLAREGRRLDV